MSGPFLYNVGYGTYEESEYVQLEYDRKLSSEKLKSICVKASVEAIQRVRKHLARCSDDACASNLHVYMGVPTFQHFFHAMLDVLKDHGFRPLKFSGKWSASGWGDLVGEKRSWGNPDIALRVPTDLKEWVVRAKKEAEERLGIDKVVPGDVITIPFKEGTVVAKVTKAVRIDGDGKKGEP